MALSRRRWVRTAALGGGFGAVAEAQVDVSDLRAVSLAHGVNLSEERLRVLRPVIEMRKTQLKSLRDFEIEDSVGVGNGRL